MPYAEFPKRLPFGSRIVELLKRLPVRLSFDSRRESLLKIGEADRPKVSP
jgi:hypothetical protein